MGTFRETKEMSTDEKWRVLNLGEVVREGDQSDAAADGYNDEPDWRPVRDGAIGCIAPDPRYPSHRRFRRRCKYVQCPNCLGKKKLYVQGSDTELENCKTCQGYGDVAIDV